MAQTDQIHVRVWGALQAFCFDFARSHGFLLPGKNNSSYFYFFKLIIEPGAGAQKKIMVGIYFIIFSFIKIFRDPPKENKCFILSLCVIFASRGPEVHVALLFPRRLRRRCM